MRQIKIEQTITNRDSLSLARYLLDIGKISLLTVEEEILTTKLIRSGDQLALEKLVRTNLRFVVSVAKKYQHRGLSLGDLINEGNVGLIKAAVRFDETKGFKFISFAVWWIRQAITLAISEQTRTIRLPLNVVSSISKINKATAKLEQKLERLPTMFEVAVELDVEEERIYEYLHKSKLSRSLDATTNIEMGKTLLDVIKDNSPDTDYLINPRSTFEDIDELLRGLTKREKQIVVLYFGINGYEPLSLEEIAVLMQLSRERIRQIKDNGINKLRLKVNHKLLK